MSVALVLDPVQQRTLAGSVAERLRRAITVGQLHPGERLTEPVLASKLGVSRAPVREALKALEGEGLVTSQANHSCYVWSPTERDVDEILSMRIVIETLAAEWAIPSLTEHDFAELEVLMARQHQLIEERHSLELVHEDKLFHDYVVQRSRHSRLINSWREIMSQWEVLIYRRLKHDPDRVFSTVSIDHARILAALRAGDLVSLQSLHREINKRVGEDMKRAIQVPFRA